MSTLYHYTTLDGLRGIVADRALRVTDVRYLSDASELQCFLDAIGTALAQVPPVPEDNLYGTNAANVFKELSNVLNKIEFLGVACFTKQDDALGQWRGYASAGQGIALHFNKEKLEALAQKNGYRFIQCDYDTSHLAQDAAEWIARFNQDHADYPSVLVDFHILNLTEQLAKFKHHSFREEFEWRLLSPPYGLQATIAHHNKIPLPQELKFRQGSSTLIPYLNLCIEGDDKNLIIEGATIGPTRERESARRAVYQLLEKPCGFTLGEGIERVCNSEVPYLPR